MAKVKIVIIGEMVHEVGYRVFLLNNSLNFGIDRFNAYNTIEDGKPAVFVFLEAEEEIITDFYEFINKNFPENARVSEIKKEGFKGRVMSIEQFMHLAMVEQLDKGIPAILSIKDNTTKILDNTSHIPAIQENTEKILEHTSAIQENTEKILDHTSAIQENTEKILDHTSAIQENTEKILEHTSYIPAIKEDTSEIKNNTREIVDKLQNKYEELSREIVQMKITLSKIEAKVFS